MIIIPLMGGLGNQLFQYAFGETLRQQTGERILYQRGYKKKHNRRFELGHFLSHDSAFMSFEASMLIQKIASWRWIKNRGIDYFSSPDVGFIPFELPKGRIKYLEGYWQSYRHFAPIQDSVIRHLHVLTPPTPYNQDLLTNIQSCTSVSIHVRRGDYAFPYRLTSDKYYQAAIQLIKERVSHPHFFIFSDDMAQCKTMFAGLENATFVENDDSKNYEDFRLMMNCKHNVIANSTFSWWAAWLNNHPDKIVIAPDVWFEKNDGFQFRMDDLLPPSWIKLPIA